MTTDPEWDQKRARLADLQRLKELISPHSGGPSAPIADALSRMPASDATEARAILDRLGAIGEDPGKTAARQAMLLDIAEWEATARAIRDDPGTSLALRRHASATLANLARLRSRLTALPDPDDSAGDAN